MLCVWRERKPEVCSFQVSQKSAQWLWSSLVLPRVPVSALPADIFMFTDTSPLSYSAGDSLADKPSFYPPILLLRGLT